MNFFQKQKLTILWIGIGILLVGFCCLIDNNKRAEALSGESWIQRMDIATGRGSWGALAISSDGRYQTISASLNGYMYTSSDYGVTWTKREKISASRKQIAMSSSGRYQTVIKGGSGLLYTSSDYGATWTHRNGAVDGFYRISMSSDGKYQLATQLNSSVSGHSLYRSSDYGVTWTEIGSFGSYDAGGGDITMSSDGKYQSAVFGYDGIYTSSDYGVTWTKKISVTYGGAAYSTGIAMSSDGKYQTMVSDANAYIYTSSNYGVTWASAIVGIGDWEDNVVMSSNGKYQAIGKEISTSLYISSDYGATWTQRSGVGNIIAMSSDGKYLTVGKAYNASNNYLYTSSDYGATWTQRGAGTADAHNWINIIMSSNSEYQIASIDGYIWTSSPTYTLTVNSSGASGVSITGSPATYSGTTNYTKTSIVSGTSLTLTAPATFGSNNFSSWSNCDSVSGTGNRTCNVTMSSDKTVTVNYTVSPTPMISVTPPSLSFGNVNIGLSSYLDLTIQNTGGGTLSGSVTGLAAPFSCTSGCSYNLSGGTSQTTTIRFSPTSAGSFFDTTDFSGGGGASSGVSGTGVDPNICQNHNVWGWAWAGAPQSVSPEKLGLGWNSFSCKNLNTGANYGVDIESDGNIKGYAYYDMDDIGAEVGWIDFDPSLAGRPGAPNRTARVDLDGTTCGSVGCVYGWARAVGYGGGWDGWIKLRKDPGDAGANYGVYIDTDDGEFHGWAWGGEVMGWISFNCDNQGTSCGVTNDHKVQTNFSFSSAPIVSDFRTDSAPTYCTSVQKRGHIDFSWLYTGSNPQSEYKIAISTNPGFGGAQEITIAQSVAPGSRGTSGVDVVPSPTAGQLEIGYNNTYYFRVKVKDTSNVWSNDWSGTVSVSTPLHAYPWPDFNWDPANPAVEETVIMDNLSKCYDSGNNEIACISWSWIKPGTATFVDSTNASSFEPHIQFFSAGDNSVTLRASDVIGVCEKTKNTSIKLPMPWWIEIPPL